MSKQFHIIVPIPENPARLITAETDDDLEDALMEELMISYENREKCELELYSHRGRKLPVTIRLVENTEDTPYLADAFYYHKLIPVKPIPAIENQMNGMAVMAVAEMHCCMVTVGVPPGPYMGNGSISGPYSSPNFISYSQSFKRNISAPSSLNDLTLVKSQKKSRQNETNL